MSGWHPPAAHRLAPTPTCAPLLPQVYAQPLYLRNVSGAGVDVVIVVTMENKAYGFNGTGHRAVRRK